MKKRISEKSELVKKRRSEKPDRNKREGTNWTEAVAIRGALSVVRLFRQRCEGGPDYFVRHQADPKEGSVLIFLAHNMVDLAQMAKGIGLGVWSAIDTFQTLASASRPW